MANAALPTDRGHPVLLPLSLYRVQVMSLSSFTSGCCRCDVIAFIVFLFPFIFPTAILASDIKDYDQKDYPKNDLTDFLINGAVDYLDAKKDSARIAKIDAVFKPYDNKGNSEGADKFKQYLTLGRMLDAKPKVNREKKINSQVEVAMNMVFEDEKIDVPLHVFVSLAERFEKNRAAAATRPSTVKRTSRSMSAPTR